MTDKRVLFIGLDATPQNWYRCILPARALGADWLGVDMNFSVRSGEIDGHQLHKPVDPTSYDVCILQQPCGPQWLERIQALRANGVRVIYETDDFLHGVQEVKDHIYKDYFRTKVLGWYDRCMEAADGVIVSTKFLRERYAKLAGGKIWICKNGIDPARYSYHRRERDYVTVGWAGATGHIKPLVEWMNAGINEAIESRPGARFLSIGVPEFAEAFADSLDDPDRAVGIPWSALETYPAAMTGADIFLAPVHDSRWGRGKSDLRWLEASALGIPCVCDARSYPEAELKAETPADAASWVADLLDEPDICRRAGARARELVLDTRAFPRAAEQWREPLRI